MKTVNVEADFPGIDDVATLTSTGTASTLRSAVSRAIADIFKRPELKRKRILAFNLRVVASNEKK